MKNNFIIIILLIFLANSCVGTSSQGVFGTGVSVAFDPRSVGTQIDDNIMEKNLIARLLVKDKKYLLSINTKVLEDKELKKRLVIYSCTSGYPVPFNQICLLEIIRLRDEYGKRVKSIGFSGHHLGISVDISAYTLGAFIIERHFTIDRSWKGTDHAASLEPNGLSKLSRDLEAVNQALNFKNTEILEIEVDTRSKLKFKSK